MTRRLVAALLALAALSTSAPAARRSRVESCARAVVHATAAMTTAALHDLQACQRRRARGRAAGACTPLQSQPPFALGYATNRGRARVNYFCKADDADTKAFLDARFGTKAFQQSSDSAGARVNLVDGLLLPGLVALLGESSAELQGDVTLAGDTTGLRCHDRLGATRTSLVDHALRLAAHCHLDRGGIGQPLLERCAERGLRVAALQRRAVRTACSRAASEPWSRCLGSDVAACATTSAADVGVRLARLAVGAGETCGNGVLETEYGETCDDGNTSSDDACTAECKPNVCGDGFVNAGVEQCDDGNRVDTDGCNLRCESAVCGNGVVEAGEQCDDANTDPADGCDQCRQVVICGASGLHATVAFPVGNLGGVRLDVGYPAALSIPGSGAETDDSRFTDLTGMSGSYVVVDRDVNADGVDDALRIVYAVSGVQGFGPGDVFGIAFDCASGSTVRLDDLTCSVDQASDVAGNRVSGVTCTVSEIQ